MRLPIMTAAYKARHDYVVPALNAIPGFECRAGEGTFYAFPHVTRGDAATRSMASDTELDEIPAPGSQCRLGAGLGIWRTGLPAIVLCLLIATSLPALLRASIGR